MKTSTGYRGLSVGASLLLGAISALAAAPEPVSVAIAKHTAEFLQVRYDYPSEGQSTWYYAFTSGRKPAISHVTFELKCPDVQILDAGMWDEDNPDKRFSKAGKPEPGSFPGSPKSDPTTGIKGLKFDLGFEEEATHHYYFTINGNAEPTDITVAIKAAKGFNTGLITGPGCGSVVTDVSSSIGDKVWLDADADGVQDAGETGVEGVTVLLLTEDGDELASQVTDATGAYLFDGLVEGNYKVQFVRPAGYVFTSAGAGTAEVDSDADPQTGLTSLLELPVSTDRVDVDAGLVASAAALALTKQGEFVAGTSDPWALCTTFGPAHAFNALVFGDFSAVGGDTDGRLAVGGNADIPSNYSVGHAVYGHAISNLVGNAVDMFIVGGDLDDGTWGVNGNIVLGGERTGSKRWMANGNVVRKVVPVTFTEEGNVPSDGSGMSFTDLRTNLLARSASFAALEDRGVLVKDTSTPYHLTLTGTNTTLNVFNLTAAEWSVSGTDIAISAPEGATVLVNVHGEGPVTITNGGMLVSGTTREYVLVNYADALSVNTSGFTHEGSVLAPKADATFSGGAINGRAVFGGTVATVTGFEFHNFFFLGDICTGSEPPPQPPRMTYTFTVENTGNVPLYGVTVSDPLVTVEGGPVDLAVGASDTTTFTATLFLTDEMLAEGVLTNTAEAVATTVDEDFVSASASHVEVFPEVEEPTPVPEDPGYETDFVVRSVDLVPSPSIVGARFTAVVRIANEGNQAADAGLFEVWSGEETYASRPSGDATRSVDVGVVQPGEVAVVEVANLRAPLSKGTYHAMAVVNASEVRPEWSYGNNHAGATYSLDTLTVTTETTGEGMLLTWNSTPGYYYFVERSDGLDQPFVDIADNLDATPPQNAYLDTEAPAGGAFYRVWGYIP